MAEETLDDLLSGDSIHISESIVDQNDNRFHFYKELAIESKAYKHVGERALKKGKVEDVQAIQEKSEPLLKNYKGKLPKTAYKEFLERTILIREHKDAITKYAKASLAETNSNICLIRYNHIGGELEAKISLYEKKPEK